VPAKVRSLVLYGNSILREKTKEVTNFNELIKNLIADLKVTLIARNGLGLAANQIGMPFSIFCYNPQPFNLGNEPVAIINPQIIKVEGRDEGEEGCLSLPGINEIITRHKKVVIKGLLESGDEITISAEGLLARIFQHEIDHLNGVLFIDYLPPLKRKILDKQLKLIATRSLQQCE
jgi:peptide deformylase